MSKDTIKVNMNIYDIPILVEQLKKLEQENKQLKEELEKKNKMYWQQQCAYYSSILYSLEEWLEIKEEKETVGTYSMVLDKIQELKEKYK